MTLMNESLLVIVFNFFSTFRPKLFAVFKGLISVAKVKSVYLYIYVLND